MKILMETKLPTGIYFCSWLLLEKWHLFREKKKKTSLKLKNKNAFLNVENFTIHTMDFV